MFLTEDHVLGAEFAAKTKMHIANVSMAKKEMENNGNYSDIQKFGQSTFINKKSEMLPEYIKRGLAGNHQFTNVRNMLPTTYVTKQFGITREVVDTLIATRTEFVRYYTIANTVLEDGKPVVKKTEFIEFDSAFIDKLQGSVPYVITKSELDDCLRENYIDGYIPLAKNKYLTWYYV